MMSPLLDDRSLRTRARPIVEGVIEFDTKLPAAVPQQVIDQYVEPNNEKVRETLDTIGRAIIPTINLRIGWLL